MTKYLAGLKIRMLRKSRGLTQRELAGRAGISASYLNLVEMNKRAATDPLLDRIAAGLGIERGALDGEAERRMISSLEEISADPALADGAPPSGAAEALVSRHPEWADLILKLYQAYLDEQQAVLALADRLNRDPFLGDSVHTMLTNVTAIRSATEILQDASSLTDADRRRFMAIIAGDSEKLSSTARALLAFFDNAATRVRSATPMEHVDAFIFETDNHFPALETAAADFLRTRLKGERLEAAALRVLGAAAPKADETGLMWPAETRRFALMRAAAHRIANGEIEDIVRQHPALGSEESRLMAVSALASYTAAAILMPYTRFLEAAERHRYDLDALSRMFGVSYEQAAHRVATLRCPAAEGVRFAFMRSDPSGYVTKRLPLPRLPLPRYGAACPLWPIYGAFQTPGITVRGFGALAAGDTFLLFARAVEKTPPSATRPRHLLSVMLACQATDAGRVVYGDGIDRAAAMMPIGTVCRLCPRTACGHRQEAPLIA